MLGFFLRLGQDQTEGFFYTPAEFSKAPQHDRLTKSMKLITDFLLQPVFVSL
jgi:hypothetical protein